MPDRRANAAEPPLSVWLFPGASLMEFKWLSIGLVIVRCPGCRVSQIVSTTAVPAVFVHEGEDCPILLRIEAALARLRAAQEGAGWN